MPVRGKVAGRSQPNQYGIAPPAAARLAALMEAAL